MEAGLSLCGGSEVEGGPVRRAGETKQTAAGGEQDTTVCGVCGVCERGGMWRMWGVGGWEGESQRLWMLHNYGIPSVEKCLVTCLASVVEVWPSLIAGTNSITLFAQFVWYQRIMSNLAVGLPAILFFLVFLIWAHYHNQWCVCVHARIQGGT